MRRRSRILAQNVGVDDNVHPYHMFLGKMQLHSVFLFLMHQVICNAIKVISNPQLGN